ncbi:hypothetical protein [Polynucleobacter asymbioticus]|jgi:hypothetical protein|uniref:Uncharacterized protein n=1 Tax=Polynucleobacter asymbioticus TaxID=576611 RepID=A0AAC9NI38_9BURK|nr:hypothetical protein [Polynucleobacter asymbioticus]APB98221.1 hypothetical protein A4F89_02145 [Polynucleobacter asymbioticus]APC00507.1 hypothetical protein AOC25_02150 [Polynucleobacter asymbioticus]
MAKYLNNLNNFSIPYDPIANLLEGDPHFQPPSFANTWLGSASYFSQYTYANSTVTQANGVSSKTIIPAFTLTGSAGGLQIKLLWDSSLSSNPNAVAFMAAIVKAAGILESEIKTTAVINLQVGWGEIAGQSPGSGAAYGPFLVNGSNCFITSSGTFYTVAQAQALGLINSVAGAASSDGSIGFSSSCPWAYADTTGINLNSYDIVGCALHELTHALGRLPGSTAAYTFGYQTSLAPFTVATNWSLGGSTIYGFSIDGGKSILNYFCPSIAGDPGDWLGTIGGGIAGYNFVDQANASMTPGAIVNTLTFSDLVELSILGYQIAASPVSMSTLYFSDVIDDIQIEKSLVTQILLSDNVPIAITAGQLSTDASALAKISGAYTLNVSGVATANIATDYANTHVSKMTINDTAANIVTNLATLQTDVSKITSITVSDSNSISIAAAQLSADATALAKISGAMINVTGITSGSAQTLSGSLGDVNFHFDIKMPGTPSATKFDVINGWTGNDVMSFSSSLHIVGSSAAAVKGVASINATTGLATFNSADNTLALQLAAVEKAIAFGSANTAVAAGDVAMWANGANTFVLMTGAHTGTAVGASDTLIELVGVNTAHVALSGGTVIV